MPSRLAFTGLDAMPRVIPINSHWTGDELVMGAFAGTYKIAALRVRPDVAVCIDTTNGGAEALLVRGRVSVIDVEGILPEYAAAHRKVVGGHASDTYLAAIDQPGLRMVRIGLRPSWVGVLDFQERFPERTPAPVLMALTGAG